MEKVLEKVLEKYGKGIEKVWNKLYYSYIIAIV